MSSTSSDIAADGGGTDVASSNRNSPNPMTLTTTQTAMATAMIDRSHGGPHLSVEFTVPQL
jgi:hypothetical protein